ncbi:unnamed protein product, partial [Larinioides sclopetarius]
NNRCPWVKLEKELWIERALSTEKSLIKGSKCSQEDDMLTRKNYKASFCSQLGNMSLPWFSKTSKANVSFGVSSTAYLHCKVHNLGNKTVSWIRKKDFHLLSVGDEVFTTDQRFQVFHIEKAHLWILEIHNSKFIDSGIYECQINTYPQMSNIFRLNILALEAHISEGSILYIEKDTPIDLNCCLKNNFGTIYLKWQKNKYPLDERERNSRGIQVITKWRPWPSTRLLITNSQESDSGIYTCSSENVQPASINIHVFDRVKTFSKDSGQKTDSYSSQTALILLYTFILLK